MIPIVYDNVYVQNLPILNNENNITLDILRIDQLHPIISGNKWFKLQLQLQHAITQQQTTIATFGGAFSNHIIATAYACKNMGLQSVGFIRGEVTTPLNHTLLAAKELGMLLYFVSREAYSNKQLIKQQFEQQNWYWVNEGGYAILGAEGVKDMYQWIDDSYTHIVAATGTGTMLAGLIKGTAAHQKVVGISALKGHHSISNEVTALLSQREATKQFEIIHDYHFGGYAKHPVALISWMNELYNTYQLPTDMVYTSKMLFGVFNLIDKQYFAPNSKIMAIHSGGLQGNLSLPKGTLVFD
jgi:1-aminocyclopropane-1-carboxylate deaminase